jgi:5-methylcytosine-specific restriction endonuclease McrA
MQDLPFIDISEAFISEIRRLRTIRKTSKLMKRGRSYGLSKRQRIAILNKTDNKCHFCGGIVSLNQFEADHVKSHALEGTNTVDNFLPACRVCNNYRWHYTPEELQWILKIGVWARGEIEKETGIGSLISTEFIKHETRREKRRKIPRTVV